MRSLPPFLKELLKRTFESVWLLLPVCLGWLLFSYPLALAGLMAIATVIVAIVAAIAARRNKTPLTKRLRLSFLIASVASIIWPIYAYPLLRSAFLILLFGTVVVAFVRVTWDGMRLLLQFSSKNEDVRKKAVTSLEGRLESVDDLAAAFARESSPEVRRFIVEALHVMSRQYKKSDEYKRLHPSHGAPLTYEGPGCGEVLEKYVLPCLRAAAKSSNREERESAVMALLWIGTPEALKAVESSSCPAAPPPALSAAPEDTQFTAYYPDVTDSEAENTLYVYAYVARMLAQVERAAAEASWTPEVGTPISQTAKRRLTLPPKIPITIAPECTALEFTPKLITAPWNDEWLPFRFTYKVAQPCGLDQLTIRVSVRVLAMEVAHIECTTSVIGDATGKKSDAPTAMNSLAAAKLASQTSVTYQSIFVSYSRQDAEVVDVYRRVQDAVGNDVFIDTYSIRAGENWRAALARAIDVADIFQLFWSENSATSPSVAEEWHYALDHRYLETRCAGFIRPVYWRWPIPAEPPDELKHLNFRYVQLLQENAERRVKQDVTG